MARTTAQHAPQELRPDGDPAAGRAKSVALRRHLERYLAWTEQKQLPESDTDSLRSYVRHLLEAGTRAERRGAADYFDTHRSVKAPRPATSAPRRAFTLTHEEERQELEAMSARDALVLRFLPATGCRVSEALRIRVERCRLGGAASQCPVIGKGGKARTVRVSVAMFKEIRSVFAGNEWLFETSAGKPIHRVYATSRMRKAIGRATGKRMSAHSLRHCFATRTIETTRKIRAVSECLGHSSVAITLNIYTHETLSDADLRIQ